MAMPVTSLPVLPFDQIEAMIEGVTKFLPVANAFLPAEVVKLEAIIPVVELDLKLANVIQTTNDPTAVKPAMAAQMRAMADKLAPPA